MSEIGAGVPQDSDGVFTREWSKATVSLDCNALGDAKYKGGP